MQQLVAQRGIPTPRVNAARAHISDFADVDGRYLQMTVMEPTTILVNRAIVWDGNIGARGCYPRRQQPQIMSELTCKRRCSVVVRPMRQCQIMLWIEKIDVFHFSAKIVLFRLTCVK